MPLCDLYQHYTAFPTNAWSRSGEFSVTNQVPKALNARANELVLQAWKDAGKAPNECAIMLSSIGVQRRTSMSTSS
jgi:hypothetical protein